MKATTLLKNDHAAVKKLFEDFRRTTARAPRRRQELIDKIAQELEPSGGWAQDERDDNGERNRHEDGCGHAERCDNAEKGQNAGRGPAPTTLVRPTGAHVFSLPERSRSA
jgi:hypothetical protein